MDSFEKYKSWLDGSFIDEDTRNELIALKDNKNELEDRFFKDLEFGTGGLRGIIGAGSNRMNIYTVRRTSQGLSNLIRRKHGENSSVVISYDSRHMSKQFASCAAEVYAGNGIKVYLFKDIRPTPVLSFAVRYYKASAGTMITASHNPKEYNGYKAYGNDGCQLSLKDSDDAIVEIDKVSDYESITSMKFDEGIKNGVINIIDEEVDNAYIKKLKTVRVDPEIAQNEAKNIKIVYTPLHGTGNKLVRRILKETGFDNVIVVKEQELPDPDFTTVTSPNPEDPKALSLALSLAKENNADIVIGTDPDCDRVGLITRTSDGGYILLTGNQIGCMLMEYVLSRKKALNSLPENGFVISTFVTSRLAIAIADYYNIRIEEVLTGFKFIGEKIRLLDEEGTMKFLFAFEESHGYLAGDFVRDKDGVVASMLIAEMAAWYHSQSMTLFDGLQKIFRKYGYVVDESFSYNLIGIEGLMKIKTAMERLRNEMPSHFGVYRVKAIRDYLSSKRFTYSQEDHGLIEHLPAPQPTGILGFAYSQEDHGLIEHLSAPRPTGILGFAYSQEDHTSSEAPITDTPSSDVLYFEMDTPDGHFCWFCIRPSGTEPKIKLYLGTIGSTSEEATQKMMDFKSAVAPIIDNFLK